MRAAVCVPFSPATLLHLGSIPDMCPCAKRVVVLFDFRWHMSSTRPTSTGTSVHAMQLGLALHAAAQSSAVDVLADPRSCPTRASILLLSTTLCAWVSSCTPHAADTHHRHNSHPQHMSSHSLSARQSHGAAGAKRDRHVCPSAQGAAHTPICTAGLTHAHAHSACCAHVQHSISQRQFPYCIVYAPHARSRRWRG